MNELILLLHQYNPYLIIATGAVAGIWGLILYFIRSEAFKPWNILLILITVLGLLQALLGIVMVVQGKKPGAPDDGAFYMHYVYGAIVVLGIPIVWTSFTSGGKNRRRDILIYSIMALFLAAIAGRAWATGF